MKIKLEKKIIKVHLPYIKQRIINQYLKGGKLQNFEIIFEGLK